MPENTVTVVDNRTNKTYTLPVENGTIRAMDLRQIKTGPEDFGLMTYDPAFMNTASCKSSITFIDGERGILRYRGYNIEELAENCTFLQVAYLLLFGELPDEKQTKEWVKQITHHTMLHETTKESMQRFRYDAHPMGVLTATVAALSTVYPEAKNVRDRETRLHQIIRLIAKVPTMAAYSYRHNLGFPYVYPDNDLSFTENFMNMLWKMVEPKYIANPVMARALDILFILHADTSRIARPTPCAAPEAPKPIPTWRWRLPVPRSPDRCMAGPMKPSLPCWPRSATRTTSLLTSSGSRKAMAS